MKTYEYCVGSGYNHLLDKVSEKCILKSQGESLFLKKKKKAITSPFSAKICDTILKPYSPWITEGKTCHMSLRFFKTDAVDYSTYHDSEKL